MLINLILHNINLKKRNCIAIIYGLLFISSCTYDKAENIPSPPAIDISYNIDIKPIIETHCNSCHSATATDHEKPGYAFFDNYEELKRYALKPSTSDPSYTKLLARILHIEFPGMPLKKDRLNESDIQKIEAWIKAGAPDN